MVPLHLKNQKYVRFPSCSQFLTPFSVFSRENSCAFKRLLWLDWVHLDNTSFDNYLRGNWVTTILTSAKSFLLVILSQAQYLVSHHIYHFRAKFEIISATPTLFIFSDSFHWLMLDFLVWPSVVIFFPIFSIFLSSFSFMF